MAAGDITISTDRVIGDAKCVEITKKDISGAFDKYKTAANSLTNNWSTPSSQSRIDSFSGFASKNFQNYLDQLQAIKDFLVQEVGEGYKATEDGNVELATLYK